MTRPSLARAISVLMASIRLLAPVWLMAPIQLMAPFWLMAPILLTAPSCSVENSREDHAVFLVVVDTLRPDRLSSYGYAGHETPGIDRLAELGIRFENAHASSSWTIPSVASLMTSLYPSELGLVEEPGEPGRRFKTRERRVQQAQSPPLAVETLAEVLADAGYRTAAFVNQPGLNTGGGFFQGFREWYYPVTRGKVARHDPAEPLPYINWGRSLVNTQLSDRALVDSFSGWIAEHASERVFAWIHLLTPHRPYNAPDEVMPGEDRVARLSRRYDAEIRELDVMVGDVLTAIDEHVGRDRATIVFVSDHGEAFGEHGMEEHGHSLHREVTRIPLIVIDRSLEAGGHFDGNVSLVDIMPTILDLAGISGSAPAGLRGESLVGTLAEGRRSQPIYSEGMLYGSTERSFSADGFKLMIDEQGGVQSLYEFPGDPDESTDIASRDSQKREELWSAMQEFRADLERRRAAIPHDDESGGVEDPDAENAMMNALKALGYVE